MQKYNSQATARSQSQNKALARSKNHPNKLATQRNQTSQRHSNQGDFHNPYNFVPALIREGLEGELGDRPPVGHNLYSTEHWSGTIQVELTTNTPLLIPDAAKAQDDEGHKTYPMRLDSHGKPYIAPTAIKGMLRSAYEAVTNSRLSIFKNHDERLAYRMPPSTDLIPARVESTSSGLVIKLLETDFMGNSVKLLSYGRESERPPVNAPKLSNGQELLHEQPVWVTLEAGERPNEMKVESIRIRGSNPVPVSNDWYKGWVCKTGKNIGNKIYERVFIDLEEPNALKIPLTPEIHNLWKSLIKNYQSVEFNQKIIKQREEENIPLSKFSGDEPGKVGIGAHIYDPDFTVLKEGSLCYVDLDDNDKIIAILPVTVSRRLQNCPPEELLDESLKPARHLDELSPADRVFGWVNQEISSTTKTLNAHKGQLRISAVHCLSDIQDALFDSQDSKGIPLSILASPKPEQAKFYAAGNKQGESLSRGTIKKDGYYDKEKNTIRGRKFYPNHHNLPAGYWDNPEEDRTSTDSGNGYYQEYRRPKDGETEQRNDQNRSILGWVKANTKFNFSISVINLSSVEVGALLWLLSLPDGHHFRLGAAKPFGFGSVQLKSFSIDLHQGQDLAKSYQDFVFKTQVDSEIPKLIGCFQNAVTTSYGSNEFENVSFIQSFLIALRGFQDNLPIHYPRTHAIRNAEDKNFEWFVDNERAGKNGGRKESLPDLPSDQGLPYVPKINA